MRQVKVNVYEIDELNHFGKEIASIEVAIFFFDNEKFEEDCGFNTKEEFYEHIYDPKTALEYARDNGLLFLKDGSLLTDKDLE